MLCKFHVYKWFQRTVTSSKYEISVSLRDEVVRILLRMIVANSSDDFNDKKLRLESILPEPRHQRFHAYMAERWYSRLWMWSRAGLEADPTTPHPQWIRCSACARRR